MSTERRKKVEIGATRIIALSKLSFECLSSGNAISAADPSVFSAWIETGETLSFEGRDDIEIVAPVDTAIWFDGSVCGATLLVNMRDIEPRKEDDGFDGAFLSP